METHVLYDCDLYHLTFPFLCVLGSQECLRNITKVPPGGGDVLACALSSARLLLSHHLHSPRDPISRLKNHDGAPGWLSSRLSVRPLSSARVMISQLVRSSPTSGSVCADGTEPAWDSLSPFLSASTLLALSLSLSVSPLQINKYT